MDTRIGPAALHSKHGDVHIQSFQKDVMVHAKHDVKITSVNGAISINNQTGPVLIDASKIQFQGNVSFYDGAEIHSKKALVINAPDLIVNDVSILSLISQISDLQSQLTHLQHAIKFLEAKFATLANQREKPNFTQNAVKK